MRRARVPLILGLVLLPLLASCASGGRPTRREEAVVLVRNNLPLPTQLTVYVVSTLGERQMLGNVIPRETGQLRFRAPSISGQYRFVAIADGGRELVSQPVALNGGDMVEWNLLQNTTVILR